MGLRYRRLKKAFFEMFTGEPEENGNCIMENGARIINAQEKPKSKSYIETYTDFTAGCHTCMIEGYQYEFAGTFKQQFGAPSILLPPLMFNEAKWRRATRCDCRKMSDVNIQIGMRANANDCIVKYLDDNGYNYTFCGEESTRYSITDGDDNIKFKVVVHDEPRKMACISCGTCFGWDMFVGVEYNTVRGNKDLKMVDIGKHLLYDTLSGFEERKAKEQVAKDICRE